MPASTMLTGSDLTALDRQLKEHRSNEQDPVQKTLLCKFKAVLGEHFLLRREHTKLKNDKEANARTVNPASGDGHSSGQEQHDPVLAQRNISAYRAACAEEDLIYFNDSHDDGSKDPAFLDMQEDDVRPVVKGVEDMSPLDKDDLEDITLANKGSIEDPIATNDNNEIEETKWTNKEIIEGLVPTKGKAIVKPLPVAKYEARKLHPAKKGEGSELVPVNKEGHRIDVPPRPLSEHQHAHGPAQRSANQPPKLPSESPCHSFHLTGTCQAKTPCIYTHDAITASELEQLHVETHFIGCALRGACRIARCPYGHTCYVAGCKGKKQGCRLKGWMHGVDLEVVAWVSPEEVPKEDKQGQEGILIEI